MDLVRWIHSLKGCSDFDVVSDVDTFFGVYSHTKLCFGGFWVFDKIKLGGFLDLVFDDVFSHIFIDSRTMVFSVFRNRLQFYGV